MNKIIKFNKKCAICFNKLLHITILFFIITISNSYSQSAQPFNLPKYDQMPLHFGMALGLNQMDFTIHNSGLFLTQAIDSIYSIENTPQVGININIVSNFNFHNYYALRFLPGLNFGQRNLTYWIKDSSSYYSHTMRIESTFLDLPVLLEYKGKRISNFRPYLIAGSSFKVN